MLRYELLRSRLAYASLPDMNFSAPGWHFLHYELLCSIKNFSASGWHTVCSIMNSSAPGWQTVGTVSSIGNELLHSRMTYAPLWNPLLQDDLRYSAPGWSMELQDDLLCSMMTSMTPWWPPWLHDDLHDSMMTSTAAEWPPKLQDHLHCSRMTILTSYLMTLKFQNDLQLSQFGYGTYIFCLHTKTIPTLHFSF